MRPSLRFTAECCVQASGWRVAVLHDPSLFNALAAASALTIAPTALGCTAVSALDHSAHKMPSPWCSMKRERWKRTMHRRQMLYLWALALALLPSALRAQEPDTANESAPVELPADAPLDLSTPEFDPGKLTPTTPFAEKPAASDWAGKVGVDYSKPAIPAVTFQPEQLLAGAVPDQSNGVAWATITAPGLESPLGWDKTSIETRVDPAQEQGKLGTTLSRSVPIDDTISLTLQNGVSLIRPLPSAASQVDAGPTRRALRLNILPTDPSGAVLDRRARCGTNLRRFPPPPHPQRRAASRRLRGRPAGARFGAEDGRAVGPAGCRRQSAGRERHHRNGCRREGGPGRLHA